MGNAAKPEADRFFPKVAFVDKWHDGTRCLEWQAALSGGYGAFYSSKTGRRNYQAHRWIYERWVGPIPDGFHIDHLCRNRACVNAAHLEVVSPGENVLRGEGFSAVNARKTECKEGHPFDETNTYIAPNGARLCRRCRREAVRRYDERRRVASG